MKLSKIKQLLEAKVKTKRRPAILKSKVHAAAT